MISLPFTHTPFFADKNRAFWILQSLGWGGTLVQRSISGLAGGQSASFLLPILISAITGYCISLVLSVIYSRLFNGRAIITWSLSLVALISAAILYAFIDAWMATLYRPNSESPFAAIWLGSFFLDMMLLGAWSALYYAINFLLQIEEQQDQLMRLANQATSAQLAMLRYQLNPHFLFNTLNSISTLVLLEQAQQANAMLTRLSSFLRYTLANEATARVPLSKEVDTLKLYLDIEKMRFEERLRPKFDIDDVAANGLLPSLLLQPLVENAIKYAVSAQEEGADILISGQKLGKNLRIIVSDTGPGRNDNIRDNQMSTGVGLANIRDRLQQGYSDNHSFETISRPEGGFSVIIEVPYETTRDKEAEDKHHDISTQQALQHWQYAEHNGAEQK